MRNKIDGAGFPAVTAPPSNCSGPSDQESVVKIVLIYKNCVFNQNRPI
jgi:hypothetical protein